MSTKRITEGRINELREAIDKQQGCGSQQTKYFKEKGAGGKHKHKISNFQKNQVYNIKSAFLSEMPATLPPVQDRAPDLAKQELDSETASLHAADVQAEREAIRISDGIHPTIDDIAPAVEVIGKRRRETVLAYRRYDPKASPAMIAPDGGDGWVLMEYPDGTHACMNTDWSLPC